MSKLILIRGLLGSGKSTLAKAIIGCGFHFEFEWVRNMAKAQGGVV